jgi:exodeoxyribonuclease VII large subunit
MSMEQLSLFAPPTWSVSEITRYLRDLLGGDPNLQDLWVLGEVSNFSRPASGHLYFTIKDSTATLRCVMWRNTAARQSYVPREGDAVEVHGSIDIYEAGGQYQLYADLFRPAGEGVLYREFLRLKAQLEAEGLFDPARKRPIPEWPHRIGIVTSQTGAALRDMLDTIRRRYPLVEVVLAATAVQGDEAPGGIVQALDRLNRVANPDVILLARGGGSIEDLWAFNDERVARAIVSSTAPVITGVGHETDFTIADFAADLRAPTPTAAAELATPDRGELLPTIAEWANRMDRALRMGANLHRMALQGLSSRLSGNSPSFLLRNNRQRLDELARRAGLALQHTAQIQRVNLAGLEQRLGTLNPLSVLGRGYAMVLRTDGVLVSSVTEASHGDALDVRLRDGTLGVRVESVGKEEQG